MRNTQKFINLGVLSAFVMGLLSFGTMSGAAKADNLPTPGGCSTATVACYTGVTVNGTDNGGHASTTTDTVLLWTSATSGTESFEVECTSNCTDGTNLFGNGVSLFGGPFLISSTSSPVVTSGVFSYTGTGSGTLADSICAAQSCQTQPIGGVTVTESAGGNFDVQSLSLNFSFTLGTQTTSTPEPSSLLMLGSGLLGLMGFGFRRKAV
jgi:hypothetical protein